MKNKFKQVMAVVVLFVAVAACTKTASETATTEGDTTAVETDTTAVLSPADTTAVDTTAAQ